MSKLARHIFTGTLAAALVLAGCSSTETVDNSAQEVVVTGVRTVVDSVNQTRKPRTQTISIDIAISAFANPDYDDPAFTHQVFKDYGVNPTVVAAAKPVSTFAMDVDTASYQLVQSMLQNGQLPPPSAVRTEEFVNSQEYHYSQSEEVFSLSAEVAPSPFRKGYDVLHVGVQARDVSEWQRKPVNLILLADVSGSMEGRNLELLKEGFMTLVGQLNSQDRITLISYSDKAKRVLDSTSAGNQRQIRRAINSLKSRGSTNLEAGMKLAYRLAQEQFEPGLIHRVVLTSDGLANMGGVDPQEVLQTIRKYRDKDVYLTTVGVGIDGINDYMLEQLADNGNGHYLHINESADIRSAFVDGLMQQLQPVAKNAKIQMQFDPNVVSHYRLLGYENRALRTEDFLDANKDGGELGAGHRVTALYEIKRVAGSESQPLGEVRVAWQQPGGDRVQQLNKSISASVVRQNLNESSADFRLSLAAAAFAEKLRMAYWSADYNYGDILSVLDSLPRQYLRQTSVVSLQEGLRQARLLDDRSNPHVARFHEEGFNFDHVPLLR